MSRRGILAASGVGLLWTLGGCAPAGDDDGDTSEGELGTRDKIHVVGYSDRESYAAGATATFFLSAEGAASPSSFNYKVTDYIRNVTVASGSVSLEGRVQSGPDARGWPPSLTLAIDRRWPSSVYCITFGSTSDGARLYFVVRDDATSPADLLLVFPTATSQAYNNAGGKSLYDFDSVGGAARKVSLDRPNIPASDEAGFGPHQAPAIPDGYGFEFHLEAPGIAPFARWLLATGRKIGWATDSDLHSDPNLLTGRNCVAWVGHNEYWSKAMRDRVDAYLADGGNVVNLAGNSAWWQIRYEDRGRTIVCYKDANLDPITDPSLKTINWNELGRSPKVTFGAGSESGGYKENGDAPALKLTCYNTAHWAFRSTGLAEGQKLDDNKLGAFEYEVDGITVAWSNGVPVAAAGSGTPNGYTVLLYSPLSSAWDHPNGNVASGIYTHASGARVFNAASVNWCRAFIGASGGALDANPLVRMTHNVLGQLIRPTTLVEYSAPTESGQSKFVYHAKGMLPSDGWTETGKTFRVLDRRSAADVLPLFRYQAGAGPKYKELLSTDPNLESAGWRKEGIACFVYPSAGAGKTRLYFFGRTDTVIGYTERCTLDPTPQTGETLLSTTLYVPA